MYLYIILLITHKSTTMQITDYDLNSHNYSFTVERNDNQNGSIKISDFFLFMSEYKGWTCDVSDRDKMYLVIPDQEKDSLNVQVFTFDSFRKEHSLYLKDFFTAYVESGAYPIEWDEAEEIIEDDAQEEAWRDFRASQTL